MKSLHRLFLLLLVFVVSLRPAAGEIERNQDTLSLDFPNEGRRAILRQVADLFELNLVIPNAFPDDKMSVKLRDVTWRRLFETCLMGTGYIYVARGNIIWIVPPDSTLGKFFQVRDRLDRATEETYELRAIIGRLTRAEARPVTKEQRAQIQAILADPASSASDLLPKLGPEPAKSPAAGGLSERELDTLNIDFPNDTCAGILRQVADLFELNLVVPPQLRDRKMSVKLRDVSWRRIFEICLLGSGYIYVARGDWVKLVRADEKLGEFGQMRDQLDRDTIDSRELRKVIAFLVRADARPLTEEQRAEIQAFLNDPASSAFDLLPKLGLKPVGPPAPTAK